MEKYNKASLCFISQESSQNIAGAFTRKTEDAIIEITQNHHH